MSRSDSDPICENPQRQNANPGSDTKVAHYPRNFHNQSSSECSDGHDGQRAYLINAQALNLNGGIRRKQPRSRSSHLRQTASPAWPEATGYAAARVDPTTTAAQQPPEPTHSARTLRPKERMHRTCTPPGPNRCRLGLTVGIKQRH